MQVTSNTLFHFTRSLKNLNGILDHKFQLTYCHEEYFLNNQKHDAFYPMVSFCDIPLSLAKDQIKKYGSYAIGMAKEWAVKNNLNPVVYIERNSLLANDIQGSLDNLEKLVAVTGKGVNKMYEEINKIDIVTAFTKYKEILNGGTPLLNLNEEKQIINSFKKLTREIELLKGYENSIIRINELQKSSLNLFRYIKNYSGELNRNNRLNSSYRFYDEREWRYIPEVTDSRVMNSLTPEKFKDYRKSLRHKPFIENINLSFAIEDIQYLLVKSSKDIPPIIKKIKSSFISKNSSSIDILTTKIITLDQIKHDF